MLRKALVEAAHAAARSKHTYLAAHHASIRGRRGPKKAAVAVGHSILVIANNLLDRDVAYEDLGGEFYVELHARDKQAYTNRLVKQLNKLGYDDTSPSPRRNPPQPDAAASPLAGLRRRPAHALTAPPGRYCHLSVHSRPRGRRSGGGDSSPLPPLRGLLSHAPSTTSMGSNT